jgi:hypothetical protein
MLLIIMKIKHRRQWKRELHEARRHPEAGSQEVG